MWIFKDQNIFNRSVNTRREVGGQDGTNAKPMRLGRVRLPAYQNIKIKIKSKPFKILLKSNATVDIDVWTCTPSCPKIQSIFLPWWRRALWSSADSKDLRRSRLRLPICRRRSSPRRNESPRSEGCSRNHIWPQESGFYWFVNFKEKINEPGIHLPVVEASLDLCIGDRRQS